MSSHPPMSPGKTRRHQRGLTLIEVLVAVLVLAIGLLGLAGLQAASMRFSHDAQLRSQATFLANDIMDRWRANRGGDYTSGMVATDCDTSLAPDGNSLAENDLAEWRNLLACRLPAGQGSIEENGNGVVTITIQWFERDNVNPGESTFTFRSRLF